MSSTPKTQPIAIIGMACRFPGDASTPERLWELCAEAQNTWSKVPPTRYNGDAFHHPRPENLGTIHSHGGHFLNEDVSLFDTSFFSLTADIARAMDPQIRMLYETTFEAFESAGLTLEQVAGSLTSCFAGAMFHDYNDLQVQDIDNLPRYFLTGNSGSLVANRLSHFFDLQGPSVAVDTACSTAMIALHLACQSIRTGDATMSIVGGTNLILFPSSGLGLSNLGLTGPSGKSFGFDNRAEGYGRGEGVSTIVLKSLDAAIRDGDPIRAVIRETGSNQDGKTPTITSPSQEAQEALIKATYARAGLNPIDTGYVESHGTGTIAGDTTETKALGNTIGKGRKPDEPLYIGSVKANVGHTESTSGLAAIIKVVEMLERETIPPHALYENPNAKIPFKELNLKVPTELTPWPSYSMRRVSISNFGAGGTNTHAIIEDARYHVPAKANGVVKKETPKQRYLFTLSAREEKGARESIKQLESYLESDFSEERLADLAYTLTQRRSQFAWRAVVSANSVDELRSALKESTLSPSQASLAKVPRLGFVFTGQGAQWHAMGRELIAAYPVFRQALEDADKHVKSLGSPWSVIEELSRDEKQTQVNKPQFSFPLSVIIQLAVVRLLDSWGVVPNATTGHSSGEISAAYAAKLLTFEDAITIAYVRGHLTAEYVEAGKVQGGMTALATSKETAQEYLAEITSGKAVVGCVNSPNSVTISGDVSALEELEARAQTEGAFFRRLRVPAAYHSTHMDPLAEVYHSSLNKHLQKPELPESNIIFASPVSGKRVGKSEKKSLAEPGHWVQNMVQCVQFEDALKEMLLSEESEKSGGQFTVDAIIEIGPHGALQGPIRQILADPVLKECTATNGASLKRGEDAVRTMGALASRLFCQGYPVNFEAVNFPTPTKGLQVVHNLPSYPWNHAKYWVEAPAVTEALNRKFPHHDLLGLKVTGLNSDVHIWRNVLRISNVPWLADHGLQTQILFPGAGLATMAIEAMHQIATPEEQALGGYMLYDVNLYSALMVPTSDDGVEVQLILRDQSNRTLDTLTYKEFSILSRGRDGKWIGHCSGKVGIASDKPQVPVLMPEDIQTSSLDLGVFYEQIANGGPTLGPAFQTVSTVDYGSGYVLAGITVADNVAAMPKEYESKYFVHPTTMDACFQIAWSTMPSAILEKFGLCLPEFAGKLYMSSNTDQKPGTKMKAVAKLTHLDNHGFEVSITLSEIEGEKERIVLNAERLKVKSLVLKTIQASDEVDNTATLKPVHKPDVTKLSAKDFQSEDKLKEYVSLFAHKHPRAKVLEVGAGARATSAVILEGLSQETPGTLAVQRYDYADVSAEALSEAEKQFTAFESQIRYQEFDIEKSPGEQGINAESYDLVIVSNLLQNATDLSKSTKYIRHVLKSEGTALILEKSLDEKLESVLAENGFHSSEIVVRGSEYSFIAATATSNALFHSVNYPKETVLIQIPNSKDAAPQKWLDQLSQLLHESTGTEVSVAELGKASLKNKTGIIWVQSKDKFLSEISKENFDALQAALLEADNLVWVSHAGDGNEGEAAMGLGLLRTLRVEDASKTFITLDLDPAQGCWDASAIKVIDDVFRYTLNSNREHREYEFSVRSGQLNILRYIGEQSFNEQFGRLQGRNPPQLKEFSFSGPYTYLEAASPGLLDSLVFKEDEALWQSGTWNEEMVEITPHAFGLNFRDVLIAMDQMQEKIMGFECSGYVSRVGSKVTHVKVGDRVCALMQYGNWANKIRTPWHSVMRIPDSMSLEAAASVPIIFGTAYHALIKLADLQEGESILIHSAAGGVGLAAIAIAQYLKAEIYVTVSSEEKREFLSKNYGIPRDRMFSSRDVSFAEDVMRATGGRGVDVLLNSLAGPLLQASWDCVAKLGRFIELGKQDSQGNKSLGMRNFSNSTSYIAMDLVMLGIVNGKTLFNSFRGVVDLFAAGKIKHEVPLLLYEIGNLRDAFRQMQRGRHIGKFVVRATEGDLVPTVVTQASPKLDPLGSYLIIGGTSGIGQEIAFWLAKQGAKNLILVSRRAEQQAEGPALVAALAEAGAQAVLRSCDVSDKASLEKVVTEARKKGPIRGVIQSAVVLADSVFNNMTQDKWHVAVGPKVKGTGNLNELFQDSDLEFFIILSSATCILGNGGQANYTAGGSYQDALAWNRVSKGLPGVSINIGSVPAVGVAARGGVGKLLDRAGYRAQEVSELLSLIQMSILHPRLGQIVTGLKSWTTPGTLQWRLEPRFAHLSIPGDGSDGEGSAQQSLKDRLINSSTETAHGLLVEALKERLADVFAMSASEVDAEMPLTAYGVDSLVAGELRNWLVINVVGGVSIFDVTQSNSLKDLAGRLQERLAEEAK
ncbi:polyketide synthase [Trichoderma atroviride IMI 206040]|uniref:Polyketide synthase n=1 Tax=Hypocrea atroviridis (strain ATCC 20476 / IMI 206040) TaxID=452589 RepID=G9NE59_HYPAI|nr:polyketide synthase [Trichoderma atroviride IMI 206040]EHK50965.1 polyketide synthase [Trichoderma atroviride IMI 206040]